MKQRTAAILVTLCILFGGLATANAQNMYGSLAYNYQTGAWGWAVDYYTQEDANYAAMEQCGYCEIVLEFWNTCAAFALGSDGAYGWGYDYDPQTAQDYALYNCSQYGYNCQIVNWACTTR